MVRLSRIYTKTGDRGKTSLGDGKRVLKTHRRIAAFGNVDELNSVLGVTVQQPGLSKTDLQLLSSIQNDLFDLGADLCVPKALREKPGARLRVAAEQVEKLESAIDLRNASLQPIASFVLPGGTAAAAWLHIARTVCRRAELKVVHLLASNSKNVGTHVLPYLNRLSDLLFVMARCANDSGRRDILWSPGASQKERAADAGRAGGSEAAHHVSSPATGRGGRKSSSARSRGGGKSSSARGRGGGKSSSARGRGGGKSSSARGRGGGKSSSARGRSGRKSASARCPDSKSSARNKAWTPDATGS